MQLTSYERYRDPSIHWLDKIPEHWDDTFVKNCFDVQLGKMLQSKPENNEDLEVPYLKALHVNWSGVTVERLPKMYASEKEIEKFQVKNGDLLICEGGEVGRSSVLKNLEEMAIIQNALHRVRNTRLGNVYYFDYLLRSIAEAGWLSVLCNKATIAHLTGDKLGAIRIPVPNVVEQTQIANFLDYKTEQIDQLIKKKNDLIEKLKEQRKVLICKAVTKGITPKVHMRDSNVPFLGEIPEHWDVKRLKFMSSIQNGADYKHIEVPESDDGYPVYGSGGVFRKASEYLYDGLSILYGRKGTIDKPLLVGGKFWTVDTMFYSIVEEGISPHYLYYFSLTIQYGYLATQTALPSITQSDLSNYYVCCPPFDEQIAIKDYLIGETERIDRMIDLNERSVGKLLEYRIGLITAAVTGQIDVRNVDIPEG